MDTKPRHSCCYLASIYIVEHWSFLSKALSSTCEYSPYASSPLPASGVGQFQKKGESIQKSLRVISSIIGTHVSRCTHAANMYWLAQGEGSSVAATANNPPQMILTLTRKHCMSPSGLYT